MAEFAHECEGLIPMIAASTDAAETGAFEARLVTRARECGPSISSLDSAVRSGSRAILAAVCQSDPEKAARILEHPGLTLRRSLVYATAAQISVLHAFGWNPQNDMMAILGDVIRQDDPSRIEALSQCLNRPIRLAAEANAEILSFLCGPRLAPLLAKDMLEIEDPHENRITRHLIGMVGNLAPPKLAALTVLGRPPSSELAARLSGRCEWLDRLLARTQSADGRLKLASIEPCLVQVAARSPMESFFGRTGSACAWTTVTLKRATTATRPT